MSEQLPTITPEHLREAGHRVYVVTATAENLDGVPVAVYAARPGYTTGNGFRNLIGVQLHGGRPRSYMAEMVHADERSATADAAARNAANAERHEAAARLLRTASVR
jgi:hypothetical protein